MLKRLGNVAWFQYKTAPQKNKGVSQKNQNKNFVIRLITKYFGGSNPMNELVKKLWKFVISISWKHAVSSLQNPKYCFSGHHTQLICFFS